jgi:lipoprotein-releasing system ATP-binding protein
MSEAVLQLNKVGRTYATGVKALTVLDGAELTIDRGEMVALVAPSGAGKSTLLHLAGLLERPDAGSLSIAGIECNSLADSERTRLRRTSVGFIYQFHHLLPELSARENIALPMQIAGSSKREALARADELLEILGLGARAGHRPSELSGGEQQRVAIARAVTNRPKLLLADEPTGNLDPETSDRVFGALTELVRTTGLAALVATHNHELASRMDRTVTIAQGKIVAR